MNIFYKYLLKGRGAEFRVLRIESDPVVEARPASCRTGVASGKRQVVVVAREVRGRTLPFIVPRESDAVPLIRKHVASGAALIHADESSAWERLHASYEVLRVNHSQEFKAEDGANVNQAESYFCRLRRAEIGQHHRISGHLLFQYATMKPLGARIIGASRTGPIGG